MTYVEPQMLSLKDFPSSAAASPNMQILEADHTLRHGTVYLTLPYAVKSGRTLRLQVIVPPRENTFPEIGTDTYPTIFYVQGSAWHEQELGQVLPALTEFSQRGYVVIIVQYRPSEVAPFPAQAKDVKTAVRWVQAHAAELHVDTSRMAMWGDSSGAHTTLMTYVTDGDPDYSDEPYQPLPASSAPSQLPQPLGMGMPTLEQTEPLAGPLNLRCYVDYYGPVDITQMNSAPSILDHSQPDSPEGFLIGKLNVLENPAVAAPTVITNHIPPVSEKKLAPLLTVHGSKDRIVPFAQSVLLHNKLAEAGQDATFYQLHGADHGGQAFWAPAVLDIVDAFLRQHLA